MAGEIGDSAAISADEKGRQMQQLLMLFESTLGEQVQRNSVTYKTAISDCENGGQWQQALELFERMLDEGVQ